MNVNCMRVILTLLTLVLLFGIVSGWLRWKINRELLARFQASQSSTSECRPGDIIFSSPRNIGAKGLEIITQFPFIHAALVLSNNGDECLIWHMGDDSEVLGPVWQCLDSFMLGRHNRAAVMRVRGKVAQLDVSPFVNILFPANYAQFFKHWLTQNGKAPVADLRHMICTELVMAALQHNFGIGSDQVRVVSAKRVWEIAAESGCYHPQLHLLQACSQSSILDNRRAKNVA